MPYVKSKSLIHLLPAQFYYSLVYARQAVPIVCTDTGEINTAQIFVAVLGASNDTFCEATWSQKLPDWLGARIE